MTNDRFKILFDRSSDAHMIVGPDGITDCNDAMVALLRAPSKAHVLAVHPRTLSPERQPDGRLSAEKSLEMDALARREGFHRFEWVHRKFDGEDFPVSVTLNAVDIDGRPSLIVVWHDLTELKRAEAQLREVNDRMRSQLEAAAEVQRSFLPERRLSSDRFDSAWFYQPCDELGGDSLNIFRIDEDRIGAYVLDVTGHGVAAALTSVTVAHLLMEAAGDRRPSEVIAEMNEHFAGDAHKHPNLTLVYGIVDTRRRTLIYSSAGHAGPLVIGADGGVRQYGSHGIPVGIFHDAVYEQTEIALSRGDRFYLFSDGVYETRDAAGRDWGLGGLARYLKEEAARSYSLEYTVAGTAREVFHRCHPKKPDDDISIVGIEIK